MLPLPLQPYATLLKAAAIAALLATAYFTGSHNATDSLTSKHQAEMAKLQADASARVIAAQQQTIATQNDWMAKYEGAIHVQSQERETNGKILASLAAGVGGVRGAIDAFAAGRGRETPDTLTACRSDATALGNLLDRALLLAGRRTADAENHATDLRAVLSAWPAAEGQ